MRKLSWIGFRGWINFKLIFLAVILIAVVSAHAVTLQDAIEIAIRVDPTLRASKFNEQAIKENIVIARARLFPQMKLQGSSNQLTQTTPQDLPTGASVSKSFTGSSINHQLVIRQALLRPKEFSAMRYAELQNKYAEYKYRFDLNELKMKGCNA